MPAAEATSLPRVRPPSRPVGLFLMTDSFGTGGSERQFCVLARNLEPQRFHIHLGCLQRDGPLAAEFGEIPEFDLGGNLHGWKSIRARLRLSRHLWNCRVQVAHAFDFYTNLTLIPAACLARVPVVIGSQRQAGDLMTPRQFRVQMAAFRGCDAVVCNSRAAADRLAAAGLSREKLVVIGNALPAVAFKPVPPALPRSPKSLRVCMVARMNARYKNHLGFLRIAAQVLHCSPNVDFVLVGDGPLRHELEQYATRLGIGNSVKFLGERHDVAAVLASVDVAVLTSESEGLSNAILEAMAAHLPVVAYNVGGNAELVNDQRGVLVHPNDENEFANSVQRMLADAALRQELGANAVKFAMKNFSLDLTLRQYEDLYESLLRTKGQRNFAS